MTITSITRWIAVTTVIGIFITGCSTTGRQAKYRGNENSPFAQVTLLQVNPNRIQQMSPQEFDEYMRRLKKYNKFARDTAYTNAYNAYGEKQWVNDEEGGPPVPPNVSSKSRKPRRSRRSRRNPTIASTATKTATKETGRFINKTMRTVSKEVTNGVGDIIKDAFDGIFN